MYLTATGIGEKYIFTGTVIIKMLTVKLNKEIFLKKVLSHFLNKITLKIIILKKNIARLFLLSFQFRISHACYCLGNEYS